MFDIDEIKARAKAQSRTPMVGRTNNHQKAIEDVNELLGYIQSLQQEIRGLREELGPKAKTEPSR